MRIRPDAVAKCLHGQCKIGKGSPYSIAKRRVPAGDVNHKPGGRLPLLSARPAVTHATLERAATRVSLLGEQRHDGCEQFAEDCYPTASRLRFEPGPFCARVQHADHLANEPRGRCTCSLTGSAIVHSAETSYDGR